MEPMIKGYVIQATEAHILDDPHLRTVVPPALLEQLKSRAAAPLSSSGFYPREDVTKLWRAIAGAYPNESEARGALMQCGRAIAIHATGTFLKLVFKILTPRMFASKFPDFWARDHQGGSGEVLSIEDHGLQILFKNIAGFDHIGPVAAGWIGFTLEKINGKQVEITCTPWSMGDPCPSEVRLEAHW